MQHGVFVIATGQVVKLRPREEVVDHHRAPLDPVQVAVVERAAVAKARHAEKVHLVLADEHRLRRTQEGLPLIAPVSRDL